MRLNKAPACNVNCQPRPGDHNGKLPASQSAVLITFGIMKDPQPPPGVLGSQYGVDEMLADAVRVQTLIHDNARPPANPSQWQPRFSDMYPTSQVSQISPLSLGAYGSLSFLSPPNGHHNTRLHRRTVTQKQHMRTCTAPAGHLPCLAVPMLLSTPRSSRTSLQYHSSCNLWQSRSISSQCT